MNIFQKIKAAKQTETESDLSAYFKFLKTLDVANPTDDDTQKLQGFMDRLGKGLVDVERDTATIKSVVGLVATVTDTANASARYLKANERHLSALEQWKADHRAADEKMRVATVERDSALAEDHRHGQARGELLRIKESNPLAFDAIVGDIGRKLKL